MSLLPNSFPVTLAAQITRQSFRAFRARVIEPGLVDVDDRGRVTRESLERHLGFEITHERYLLADRARDGARRYQQRYRNSHKTEMTDAV